MDETLDELIQNGEKAIEIINQQFEKQQEEAGIREEQRKREFIRLLGEILPPAVRPYREFERWHAPNYDFRDMWNAEAVIRIPGMARILVLCSTFEPVGQEQEMHVSLYDRHGNDPFHVLGWGYGHNEYDNEYYVTGIPKFQGSDLLMALFHAKEIGDNFEEAQQEVNRRNLELAAQSFKQEEVVISTSEVLLNALREFIADEIQRQKQLELE